MGFKDRLDRLKSTRVGKPSKFEKKEHEENAEKYSNKKFHHKHNANKPKSQSIREQVITKVMAKGRDLQEKSKQHAIDELKKSKKSKKEPKRQSEPRPQQNQFNFGGNMENFGYDMFSNKKKSDSKEQTKEQTKEQGFNFGFGQSDVPYDEMFNFRTNADHSKLFKKKKSDVLDDVWNPKDFWN